MSKHRRSEDPCPQSPNWERRDAGEPPSLNDYPFNEDFPNYYRGKTYTLIMREGGIILRGCTVDDSRQYRAEGLSWRDNSGYSINKAVVVAWKQEDCR